MPVEEPKKGTGDGQESSVEGFLGVSIQPGSGWRKGYFSYNGGQATIYEYADDKKANELGRWGIGSYINVKRAGLGVLRKHKFRFDIIAVSDSPSLRLNADNKEVKHAWLLAFEKGGIPVADGTNSQKGDAEFLLGRRAGVEVKEEDYGNAGRGEEEGGAQTRSMHTALDIRTPMLPHATL